MIRNGKYYIMVPLDPSGSVEIEVSREEHSRIKRVRNTPPTLYASDLLRREKGAVRLDIIANADGSHNLTFTYALGRTRTETTAICRIVLPHEEKEST